MTTTEIEIRISPNSEGRRIPLLIFLFYPIPKSAILLRYVSR